MPDARDVLQPLVGEWSLAIVLPGQERPAQLPDIGARNTWEWMGDGRRIDGAWFIAHDHETWEKDFDLVYTRVDVT
jgi:hypothetical protein